MPPTTLSFICPTKWLLYYIALEIPIFWLFGTLILSRFLCNRVLLTSHNTTKISELKANFYSSRTLTRTYVKIAVNLQNFVEYVVPYFCIKLVINPFYIRIVRGIYFAFFQKLVKLY